MPDDPETTKAAMVCWAKVLRDENSVLTMSAREKIAKLLDTVLNVPATADVAWEKLNHVE
jgi:hypothetical protein